MAHYSIYVPDAQGVTDDHLSNVGLGDLLADGGAEWSEVTAGPDGGRGMYATWWTGNAATDPFLGIDLKVQHWQEGPGDIATNRRKGAFWIGWEKERPPRPDDLIRSQPRTGHNVVLRDRNYWLVPEAMKLPYSIVIDPETRRAVAKYAPEFADFGCRADKYVVILARQLGFLEELRSARPLLNFEETETDVPRPDAWLFCCQALAVNYRVNTVVIDALQLITESHIVWILFAALSLPDILGMNDSPKQTATTLGPAGVGEVTLAVSRHWLEMKHYAR